MKDGFCRYLKENRKKIIYCFFAVLGLVCLVFLKNYLSSPYVYGKDGELIQLKNNGNMNIEVHLKAAKKGKVREEDRILDFSIKNSREKDFNEDEYELENEVAKVIHFVEQQRGEFVKLPLKGKDGLEFTWTAEHDYSPLLLLLLYPVLIYTVFYSRKEKQKKMEKEYRRNIKRMLPGFNQQLVLLMNSGLVLSDAYERIAIGYMQKKGKKESFEKLIIEIYKEEKRTGESLSTVIKRYSHNLCHREFSRLAAVITEHEYRGNDLRDKLLDESRMLWEERKKDAEAAGKTGETKLSFPLGILLVVLIMITAAPAVLEM